MNMATNPQPMLDMIIIGAGISGIGMAVHMRRDCPGKSIAIVERRDNLGGTWDLFRYPGIRSDSDMHTLGFAFEPWTHEKAIADGPAILDYLTMITAKYDLAKDMHLGSKVVSADWDSKAACWTVTSEDALGKRQVLTGRFLFLGSGYYDYDNPYDAGFAGRDTFKGQVIHPQFWPEGLDYTGKKVVVIGSGATAVTIVPAMAQGGAEHVTMLQRTPTWMASRPAKDALANGLRKILPEKVAYKLTRAKNILMQDLMYKRVRSHPEKAKEFLSKQVKGHLGEHYDEHAFTPPYNPWEQRLCLVPDADFFAAMKAGKASIVTDRIASFDKAGIKLESGQHLDAEYRGYRHRAQHDLRRQDRDEGRWRTGRFQQALLLPQLHVLEHSQPCGDLWLRERQLDLAGRHRRRVPDPAAQADGPLRCGGCNADDVGRRHP
jgi:monooxygenase